MKYFKCDKKENIPVSKAKDITLDDALIELDNLQINTKERTFIGFVNDKTECIQFITFETNSWILDIPVLTNGKFSHSLQNDNLSTKEVKTIVKKFFESKKRENLSKNLKIHKIYREYVPIIHYENGQIFFRLLKDWYFTVPISFLVIFLITSIIFVNITHSAKYILAAFLLSIFIVMGYEGLKKLDNNLRELINFFKK